MVVAIRAEHVNPFILSTMETFTKMVGVEARPGKAMLKKEPLRAFEWVKIKLGLV